jgi:hypothetical protein
MPYVTSSPRQGLAVYQRQMCEAEHFVSNLVDLAAWTLVGPPSPDALRARQYRATAELARAQGADLAVPTSSNDHSDRDAKRP